MRAPGEEFGDVFPPGARPLTVTRADMLAILDDLREWISQGDSMEGSFAYEWGKERDTYHVAGALRFGNSMGQGSVRLLQDDPALKPVTGKKKDRTKGGKK